MSSSGGARRALMPGVAFLAVMLAIAAVWMARRDFSPLPEYGEVPAFSLVNARGEPVRRADLEGKVWVADLIYTRCDDTCPLQSAEMAKLMRDFAGEADFRQVSITTDPGYDKPAVLTAYAKRFGADAARWWFLTGPEPEIARLAKEGFKLAYATKGARLSTDSLQEKREEGDWFGKAIRLLAPAPAYAHHPGHEEGEKKPAPGILVSHSSRFVLVDRAFQIRGYYLSDDPAQRKRLREDIRTLLR